MTQPVFDFSSYSATQVAFESIGASAWQARSRLISNRLTTGLLVEFYQSLGSFASVTQELNEDSIYGLLEDGRRHALLEAISILDSLLSDCLRFLFLYKPSSIPKKQRRSPPISVTPSMWSESCAMVTFKSKITD